jgi:hypothetical protein
MMTIMMMMMMMMRSIKTKKQNTFCYLIMSVHQLSLPIIVFAIAMVQNHGPPTQLESSCHFFVFFSNERGSIRCS